MSFDEVPIALSLSHGLFQIDDALPNLRREDARRRRVVFGSNFDVSPRFTQ